MRESRMLAEQRRRKILDLIEQKGQITIRELVEQFAVSAVTARGHLDGLCSQGLAFRSHGGAVRKLEARQDSPSDVKERPRFGDVARLAKVSLATVSRVTNGDPKVAPAVRATVIAAARKLGTDLTVGRENCTITLIL